MNPIRFGAMNHYQALTNDGMLKKVHKDQAFAAPEVDELTLYAQSRTPVISQAVRLTGQDASDFLSENYDLNIAPDAKVCVATLSVNSMQPDIRSEQGFGTSQIIADVEAAAVDDKKTFGASLFEKMLSYIEARQ
jgi:hypothetical protein